MSAWRAGAYASPSLITSLAWMPLGYVIVKYYAKYTSLDLATIGTVILVARFFDAISDPLIAFISDGFPTRWGRRKPWIVISAPIMATGFVLMFMPSPDIHWLYFLTANITLYVGWTCFEITHIAWGLEVMHGRRERAQLGVSLKVLAYAGSLIFFAFPFFFNPEPNSSEFTPPVMKALGIVIAISFPILVFVAVKLVPREPEQCQDNFKLSLALKEIAVNKAFHKYALAFVAWAIADAIMVALFLIFVDVRLNLSAFEGVILLVAYGSRLCFAPFMYKLLQKYSNSKLWILATLGNVSILPLVALIPGGEFTLIVLCFYTFMLGAIDSLIGILVITLLGEVVDIDTAQTGSDKAASYKAMINLLEKGGRAIGTSASLIFVGYAGLTVDAENGDNSIWVLVATLAIIPAALNLFSAFIIKGFPVSERTENGAC